MFRNLSMTVLFTLCFLVLLMVIEAATPSTTRMKSKKECKFPAAELLSGDPGSILSMQDGHLTQTITTTTLLEWRDCVGHIDKSFARRMLPRLQKSFVKSEGGKEILSESKCKTGEILEIFDPRASATQAETAGECLEETFNSDESSIGEVVRIDEDCEREKRNKIRELTARVAARLAATAAAGVCCAATPAGGVALAWCGVFAGLAAATLEAEAELAAAMAMECPSCSDTPTARFIGDHDRKSLRLAAYNNFYTVQQLPPPQL